MRIQKIIRLDLIHDTIEIRLKQGQELAAAVHCKAKSSVLANN